MFYEDFNEEIRSSFLQNSSIQSSITDKSQIPQSGLKARTLLDEKQLQKLKEIRVRRLCKSNQIKQFITD